MRHKNCDIDHRTIAEVKACAGTRRKVADALGISLITPKQKDFLRALMEQTETAEAQLPTGSIDSLTKEQASAEITRLKNKKQEIGHGKVIDSPQVPQGTYTVVFDSPTDDRITVRFRTPREGRYAPTPTRPEGTQIVSYLYGPDNESDYRRFANWNGNGYRIWAAFTGASFDRLSGAINALANPDTRQSAGWLYALASGNCYRCGRTLTVPLSIHRGLGPDCARQVGVA